MSWFDMMLGAAVAGGGTPGIPADVIESTVSVNYDKQIFGSRFGTAYPLEAAFDGNLSTFSDIADYPAYMGQQLYPPRALSQIRYAPRASAGDRMVGGKFQGSTADPVSGYVDLYTITTAPPEGVYTTVTISDPTPYKWVRYVPPSTGYANVADIEFVTIGSGSARNIGQKITNTIFGLSGSYPATNAFDGNVSTFADGNVGSFLGMEFNQARIVRFVRIYSRLGAPERTIGLRLQGGPSQAGPWTTLHSIDYQMQANVYNVVQVASQSTAYKCYRLLSTADFLSIAELEFYI